MSTEILSNLNSPQKTAVQTVNGPVLVLAGPGSGKTRVLTRRIAYLIEEAGIASWNILAVTFTNKAAREMQERVEELLQDRFSDPLLGQPRRLGGLTIGTFHSICARVLRIETSAIGYERNWVIYDDADQLALIRGLMREMNLDEKRYSPNAVRAIISRWKNELHTPETAQPTSYPEEIASRVYGRYQEAMQVNNAMDFDDLLMKTMILLCDSEELRIKYQQRWQYILVDEFQDTNTAQYELIRLLANEFEGKRNLFVVGDEDQCIISGTLIDTPDGPKTIESLEQGDAVIAGSGHGSSAIGKIDAVLKRQYDGPVITVETKGKRRLVATPEHCVFGRFRPYSGYHYVYLMFSSKLGYRIGRTGSTRTNGEKVYLGFAERLRQEHGDAIWLLKACSNISEAAYWESFLSAKYSLPTVCFYAGGRQLAVDDEEIQKLYQKLDTISSASHLARDLGISLAHPHHVPQETIRGKSVRKSISFKMFGSMRQRQGRTRWKQIQDPWHLHELSICSSDPDFREQVNQIIPTKNHKKLYWAARRNHSDYDQMEETLNNLQDAIPDVCIWRRARFTNENFDYMPIGHLLPGAIIPVTGLQNQIVEDEVVSVTREEYSGFVYDLSVPTYRNYAAGGIIVHNSVYRFRGADYRNVANFRNDYPDAKVILLEQNYRSTQNILAVANSVIANNPNRTPKKLHTENGEGLKVTVYEAYNETQEGAWVCDEIERLVGSRAFGLGDFAIMYRTNAQSRALEETFVMRQIKHKLIGATRFYERKEIKDALAYLRLVHNPADTVAMDRIINVPTRGIGAKTYAALKEWANEIGASPYTALLVLRHGPESMSQSAGQLLPPGAYKAPFFSTRAKNALVGFITMLEEWIALRNDNRYSSVADLLDTLLDESGYVADLRDGSDEGEDRFPNLQELRGVAAQYYHDMLELKPEQTPLSLFLEEVSLVSDSDEIEDGQGAVTLMTLHTAKGLEYPVVFMVGLEEGILPHARSIESIDQEEMAEERRLAYVGITRAEKRLYLVHAFRRSLWGRSETQESSRFLDEIPADLLSGMVDRHSKRASAYQHATSWDDEFGDGKGSNRYDYDDVDGYDEMPRRFSRSRRSQRRREADSTWDRADNSEQYDDSTQSYWSPDSSDSSSRSSQLRQARSGSRRSSRSSSGDSRLGNKRGRNNKITRPSQQSAAHDPQFKRRDSVHHEVFGVGTVIESEVTRTDEEVTVAFPGVGIKKLMVSIANLKKL